ncbi:histidine phosphatase family protein [Maritimibacter sp. HL-12]|jgi:alpha-ribazole phosphatase|uniref:histidine phosphatase family protein n=1 Tax=Maritimibacter sp. HL-12 TaxID=1162418 RepID=UPI000A0F3C07|nr:histidine phosphatase family protein [Maritimibacter sp. HL-12]SMH51484.1 Broad specificity phosphatase PhoE [Maritimibacter sp. HL-12]
MTEIWWVRHGPTHRKDMIGWTDAPADLSDTEALSRLAAYLPDAPVVSSDLSRAVATADAILGARPRLGHLPGLRELNFGAWEGRSAAELYDEAPEIMTAYWNDPASIRPPGGESFTDLAARVNDALDALAEHPRVIAVAHFGVILTQIHRARGGDVKQVLAERIENLSVTELRRGPSGWNTGRINHRP